jgi:hypothetical protein
MKIKLTRDYHNNVRFTMITSHNTANTKILAHAGSNAIYLM